MRFLILLGLLSVISAAYLHKPRHVVRRQQQPSTYSERRVHRHNPSDEYAEDFFEEEEEEEEEHFEPQLRRRTKRHESDPITEIREELNSFSKQVLKRMDTMEKRLLEIQQFQDDLSVVIVNQTSFLSKTHQMIRVAVHDQIAFRSVIGNLTESVNRNLIATTLIKSQLEEEDLTEGEPITASREWNGARKEGSTKDIVGEEDTFRFKREILPTGNVAGKGTEKLADEVEECGKGILTGIDNLGNSNAESNQDEEEKDLTPRERNSEMIRKIHMEVMKTKMPYLSGNRKEGL